MAVSGERVHADEAETKLDVRAPAPVDSARTLSPDASGRSLVGATSATSLTTAVETLRVQEIDRTRAFIRLILVLAVVTAACLYFVGGDPVAKRVLVASLFPVVGTATWLGWLLRDEAAYDLRRVMVAAYASMVAAFGGIYFFGVYSPAVMILPFGLHFFSGAQSRAATLAVYLTCAGGYAALVGAIGAGLLADRGIVHGDGVAAIDRAVLFTLVEAVMLLGFLQARATRGATLAAIERHDRVVRGLAQREALLKEAREELDRAIRSGGMGRFTDTILGSYRLGRVIGRGAMGEVYEATHTTTQTLAAVKLLHSHALSDPDLLKRFLREAEIARALDTPHVVKVVEIGGLEATLPYIAMERLHGEDLGDYLREHRQMPLGKTAALVRQVGRGLEAARAAGIVHRDLKPRNLFYAESGSAKRIWKILDFGISKLGDAEGTQQTKDIVVGTPGYMAPEQAAGREVSHRTDLFALGAIAYRTLTGRPAFSGDHVAETMFQVAHAMPPRPSELLPGLPADVDAVLAIALAKSPADRFDGATEMSAAFDAAALGALSPELRARAARLLDKLPWGSPGA